MPTNGVMAYKKCFVFAICGTNADLNNKWVDNVNMPQSDDALVGREALIPPARSGNAVLNTQGWDNINTPRLGDVTVCKL